MRSGTLWIVAVSVLAGACNMPNRSTGYVARSQVDGIQRNTSALQLKTWGEGVGERIVQSVDTSLERSGKPVKDPVFWIGPHAIAADEWFVPPMYSEVIAFYPLQTSGPVAGRVAEKGVNAPIPLIARRRPSDSLDSVYAEALKTRKTVKRTFDERLTISGPIHAKARCRSCHVTNGSGAMGYYAIQVVYYQVKIDEHSLITPNRTALP